MTIQEIRKFRKPMPESYMNTLKRLGVPFVDKSVSDKYGVYSTGYFEFKGKSILINIEGGNWHLSASANHALGYFEIKEIRYKFLPDGMEIAQIFPPRKEFVNIDENCYHLWQIKGNMESEQNEKETK